MIKILITGGAGNVGGALARKLVDNKKYFVVIADDLSTGSKSKLPSSDHDNWSFVYCDVNNYRDISELMLAYKFDYVFHYAAMVGVQRTQENPIQVLNDIEGIKNVLNLSKNTSVKRAFFSSSSEVEKTIEMSIESSITIIIEGTEIRPKNNTAKKIDPVFLNISLIL